MNVKESIEFVKNYKDPLGFDIADATNLRTKKDCIERMEEHCEWLELMIVDTIHAVERDIRKIKGATT